MDPLSVFIGWGEKVLGAFRQAARADLRIADEAKLLRRQLAASFEDWPRGPQSDNEFLMWAHSAARGFKVTQPTVDGLVRQRPEASRHVRRAIGTARDEYYAAADFINPAVRTRWKVVNGESTPEPADPAPLRKAWAHFKQCIAALDDVIAKHA